MTRTLLAYCLIVLASCLCPSVVAAQDVKQSSQEPPAAASNTEELASEIRELHIQRIKVAQASYDQAVDQYKAGRMEFEVLFKSDELLRQARYEAATTHEARVEALTSAVQTAQANLELATRRFEAGAGGSLAVQQADYSLLTVKLKLAQEKQRNAQAKSPRLIER